jgi:outer membrane protein TolC
LTALRTIAVIIFSILILSSCASVQTDEEWSRFKKTSAERTGHELLWEQSEDEKAVIRNEVKALLSDGLTRDEAVRVALLNNRLLQSRFEEIGISKSDLVQAGLYRNPSIAAVFRFPLDGGSTNIGALGFFSLADLWQIPIRKKVAAQQLEITMIMVNQTVLDTAAEAKRAYDTVYYFNVAEHKTEEILRRFEEISDQVKIRHGFGFSSDLDVYLSQIMVAEAEIELNGIQNELSIAKAHLDQVLGLRGNLTDYAVKEKSKFRLDQIPNAEVAIQHGLSHRLDIQMARFKIIKAERNLELEKRYILREVNIGLDYERETDREEVLGPAIELELPLFDQNQAQIAKARFMLRQARKTLQALEGQVMEEIIADLKRVDLLETRARMLEEKTLPLRQKSLDYSNKWVNAMQLNRLFLLEAQKGLIQAELDFLKTQMELLHALVDLERHLGGSLP